MRLRNKLVALATMIFLAGCTHTALIMPTPIEAGSSGEAERLSKQIFSVVDEVATRRGYVRQSSLPQAGGGVTAVAAYFLSDGQRSYPVQITVVIGGLRGVNGPIMPRDNRTIATVGSDGEMDFGIHVTARAILARLRKEIPSVQFRLETGYHLKF